MEHIKTIETRNLCDSAKNGGCGECQTSCQSACKTSCGIAISRGKRSSMPQPKTRPDSPVPSLQGPCNGV